MIIVVLALRLLHRDGWQSYAQHGVSGITRMEAEWTVPSDPVSPTGTIFIFPALQNVHDTSEGKTEIMQPVLQWGSSAAGGGNWWAVASWYISTDREVHTSRLIRVKANDTIHGEIAHIRNSTWAVTAKVNDETTRIEANGVPKQTYAFISLETYGVNTCGSLPSNDIYISSAGNWTSVNPRRSVCGEHISCDTDGCIIKFQVYL